ncbi:MAG: hypothetical protein EAZ29_05000 [Runella slithyformis]|nr:MAG: hypothetical protein EAZ29_05000 [Runella slithyformis]
MIEAANVEEVGQQIKDELFERRVGSVFMKQILISAVFLMLLGACQSNSEADQTKTYYDLKGFLEQQIKLLNAQKPQILKQTTMGNTSDRQTTSAIDWAKELELFMQTDLNKSAFKLSYTTTRPDSTSYEYRLKAGEKLPVKYLIIKTNSVNQVEELAAEVWQENKLYNSEKRLLLTCGTAKNGTWQLQTYEVTGFQKLAMSDKKAFSVRSSVLGK